MFSSWRCRWYGETRSDGIQPKVQARGGDEGAPQMLPSTTVAIIPTGRTTEAAVYKVSDLNIHMSNTVTEDIYHLVRSSKPTFTSSCTGRRVETGVAGINIPLRSRLLSRISKSVQKHQPWLTQQIRRIVAGRKQISPPAFYIRLW
jgi:hypothetical protein